jgi:hypothetical protein
MVQHVKKQGGLKGSSVPVLETAEMMMKRRPGNRLPLLSK